MPKNMNTKQVIGLVIASLGLLGVQLGWQHKNFLEARYVELGVVPSQEPYYFIGAGLLAILFGIYLLVRHHGA